MKAFVLFVFKHKNLPQKMQEIKDWLQRKGNFRDQCAEKYKLVNQFLEYLAYAFANFSSYLLSL